MTDPPRPARPVLRPGLRLARRCDGLLQAGLEPGARLGLPDSPAARRLAEALARLDERPPPGAADALTRLGPLLVDGDELAALLADAPGHRGAIAAAYHRHGAAAAGRWRARGRTRVRVDGPAGLAEQAGSLLTASGVAVAPRGRADVHLLLHVGEPPPDRADPLLRDGVPHLWAGTSAGRVTAGPFVEPGRTACRRCVVAHRSAVDPGHALLLEQYADADGDVPEPADPALLATAVARAVRDLVAWADGETPLTWSATADVPADDVPVLRRFARHPECGCSWTGAWLAG
jgi:hypothetical protein